MPLPNSQVIQHRTLRFFQNSDWSAFWATFLIGFSFFITHQKAWFLSGEIWAEMGSTYNAFTGGSLGSDFLRLDAGYFPLPQRLLNLLGQMLQLTPKAFPFFQTITSGILSSLLCALPASPHFRLVIKSDFLRFSCAILFACFLDFETTTFINFTYSGALFLGFWGMALNLQKNTEQDLSFQRQSWWMSGLAAMLFLSKPTLLAFLILPALAGIRTSSKQALLHFARMALPFLFGAIQLGILFLHRPAETGSITNPLLLRFLILTPATFFSVLAGPLPVAKTLVSFSAFAACLQWLTLLLLVCLRRKIFASPVFLAFLLLSASVSLNIVALGWDLDSRTRAILTEWKTHRALLISYTSVLLFFALYMDQTAAFLSKKIQNKNWIGFFLSLPLLGWAATTGWLDAGLLAKFPSGWPTLGNSSWQEMHRLFPSAQPDCIPINPFGWLASGGNCRLLNPEVVHSAKFFTLDLKSTMSWNKSQLLGFDVKNETSSILAIGIPMKSTKRNGEFVELQLRLTGDDFSLALNKHQPVSYDGNLVVWQIPFSENRILKWTEIQKIELESSQLISFFASKEQSTKENPAPAILWMGK